MFYLLRQIAQEHGPRFRAWLGDHVGNEALQGVHLGMDPLWAAWIRQRPWHPLYGLGWADRGESPELTDWFHPLTLDQLHSKPPPGWEAHCAARGLSPKSSPLIFKVIFRDDPGFWERRLKLPDTFETVNGYFQVVSEVRPPVRALCQPGDSIGPAQPGVHGTLGGILVDARTREPYLVTCAHVCSAGSIHSPGKKGNQEPLVANVVHSVLPPVNTENGCNRCSHPKVAPLDLAIARLTPQQAYLAQIQKTSRPHTLTPIKAMKSDQAVFFLGNVSGLVDAELGELCIYHEILIGGKPHCFGDIFTLTPQRPWYLNTDLAKGGDSGAWITRLVDGFISWDGMLIGGDGIHGYASFASNILESCQSAGLPLVLP